ncbi:hypothetical protein M758_UG014800 [Ceratodon purpureus]|nr:hypothetical protein M758_UG014800 [Ceratodon purpureus]
MSALTSSSANDVQNQIVSKRPQVLRGYSDHSATADSLVQLHTLLHKENNST